MTITGFNLVIIGLVLALVPPYLYDGRWLLGGILAALGIALLWHDRKGGPRDCRKE